MLVVCARGDLRAKRFHDPDLASGSADDDSCLPAVSKPALRSPVHEVLDQFRLPPLCEFLACACRELGPQGQQCFLGCLTLAELIEFFTLYSST